MRIKEWRLRWAVRFLPLVFLAGTVPSCDDGNNDETVLGGTVEEPIVARGAITGFGDNGEIIVSGVEFDTNTAQLVSREPGLTIDDVPLGTVVVIEGRVRGDTGVADTIRIGPELVGPIDAIDPALGTLEVAGQQVAINSSTLFGGAAFDDLALGNVVEVSGLPRAGAPLLATRIDRTATVFNPDTSEILLRGRLRDLDPALGTFRIGDTLVDFTNADLGVLDENDLIQDGFFEVRGTRSLEDGRLVANRIATADDFSTIGLEGDRVAFEGVVDRRLADNRFDIGGRVVELDDNTLFSDGVLADLQPGQQVRLQGVLGSDGVLIADEATLRPNANVLFRGRLDDINGAGSQLGVFGRQVGFDTSSMFDDDLGAPLRVADLGIDDPVEIRGFTRLDDSIFAQRLRRRVVDPGDPFGVNDQLIGPVSTVGATDGLTVAGVPVRTSPATSFRSALGDTITEDDFFAGTTPGTAIRAEGRFENGFFEATDLGLDTPAVGVGF